MKMFITSKTVTQDSNESQAWETVEIRNGETIIERHEVINGITVINRVF
jgi:hypothetical protein